MGGGKLFQAGSALDALIITRPDQVHDVDLRTAKFNQQLVDNRAQGTRLIIEATSGKPLYLSAGREHVVEDRNGEIPPEQLSFLRSGSRVQLVGGYIDQFHRSSFSSIVVSAMEHGLVDVSVEIPYAGCFVSSLWREGNGPRVEGPEGRCMQILEWPRQLQRSYSLADVGAYQYETSKLLDFGEPPVAIKRDATGTALQATGELTDGVLFRIYFEGYVDPHRYEALKGRPTPTFSVSYDKLGAIVITINPSSETLRSYEDTVLAATSWDRFPLVSPELLEQIAQRQNDKPRFLGSYLHRIEERFPVLSSREISAYANIYAQHAALAPLGSVFVNAHAQASLNEAIVEANPEMVETHLGAGARPQGRGAQFVDLGESEDGMRVLKMLLPHLKKEEKQDAFFWAAREGRENVVRLMLPHVDKNAWDRSFSENALTAAWRNGWDKVFDVLLEAGANPVARDGSGRESLLSSIAVFASPDRLTALLERISFSEEEILFATRAFDYWNVPASEAAPKVQILERAIAARR